MGQTGLLVKLDDGNKDCEWIYRFRANPGRPRGGILPPAPVLAPGAALGSRPRVAFVMVRREMEKPGSGDKVVNTRTVRLDFPLSYQSRRGRQGGIVPPP